MKKYTIKKTFYTIGGALIILSLLTFWFYSMSNECTSKLDDRIYKECGYAKWNASCSTVYPTECTQQVTVDFSNFDSSCGDFGKYWFGLIFIVVISFIWLGYVWRGK